DGSGAVHFNLDPLWSHPAIDAVGIDNYMPLSDWRDGDRTDGSPDGFRLSEDRQAMRSMIAAGEGFDWYYASDADRRARTRSPIADGLAGKPWVYRYKDLEGWWTHRHYDRAGGAEASEHTGWEPRSKPIWFTELGCPAVDKGANQPNVFVDPKSSEDALPYFSAGSRADAMQRRFLDAHHLWWQGEGPENGMVDPGRIFLWTWDARPYPAFPETTALWADGENWRRGHWLNGRLGAATVSDVLAAILRDHGFDDFDVSAVGGDLSGLVQAEIGSARQMLEPLLAAFQIDAVEEGGTLVFCSRLKAAQPAVAIEVMAEVPDEAAFEETRGHADELAGQAVLDHFGDSGGLARVTTRSRRASAATDRVLRVSLPAILHAGAASSASEAMLLDHRAGQRRLTFRLSPADLAVVPGDVVTLANGPAGRFVVTGVTEGTLREIEARSVAGGDAAEAEPADTPKAARAAGSAAASAFMPELVLLDLPPYETASADTFARVGAYADPWRPVLVSSSAANDGYAVRRRLDRPAGLGLLAEPLAAGPVGRIDRTNAAIVDLPFGGLASVDPVAMLGGANRLAVRAANGEWEVLGFEMAEEVDAGRWRLTRLLRGLGGSEDAMRAGHDAGTDAVLLDGAVQAVGLAADEAGRAFNWIAETPGAASASDPTAFAGAVRARLPLSPVHLNAQRLASGDIALAWVRRGRIDADDWTPEDIPLDEPFERYRVEILAGGTAVRTFETEAPHASYTAAQELADFGMSQAAIAFRVAQKGSHYPVGTPAEALISL
ncbi:glycoside hydrolase/phage tail family protein, partial [Rhizobium sp. TRM95111]|uniref:baseplate multidomain protein megatron n=1 Tax=Rhizobium alarense TaxID=2846851 RepID=UPI001F420EAF